MRNTFKILPVLTGDVSGAASALFELGGMTVIHDPSGCNSTYNTHDETRWYSNDSLIYITGLNDVDAITGNDEKFINSTIEAAQELNPKFISLTNSPIPFLNGTDFEGICKIISSRTGIRTFHVNTNAAGDYISGASKAFEAYVKAFADSKPVRSSDQIRVAVIGATPLDLANPESVKSVASFLADYGFEPVYCLGMDAGLDSDPQDKLTDVDVNLVISSAGIRAAMFMEEKFNIPYVAGFPAEGMKDTLAGALNEAYKSGVSVFAYSNVERSVSDKYIVGEPVVASSIAAGIKRKYDIDINVIAVTYEGLVPVSEVDAYSSTEDTITEALKDAKTVIADPLYKYVSPADAKFIRLPHLAMSGRLYLKEVPDLCKFDPIKEGLL